MDHRAKKSVTATNSVDFCLHLAPAKAPRPEDGTAGILVLANREAALEEPRSPKPKSNSENSDRGMNSAIGAAEPGPDSERGVEGLRAHLGRIKKKTCYQGAPWHTKVRLGTQRRTLAHEGAPWHIRAHLGT